MTPRTTHIPSHLVLSLLFSLDPHDLSATSSWFSSHTSPYASTLHSVTIAVFGWLEWCDDSVSLLRSFHVHMVLSRDGGEQEDGVLAVFLVLAL